MSRESRYSKKPVHLICNKLFLSEKTNFFHFDKLLISGKVIRESRYFAALLREARMQQEVLNVKWRTASTYGPYDTESEQVVLPLA
jgi:coproporphyrinogen III oxidase-like Fe-S oxidoreductase